MSCHVFLVIHINAFTEELFHHNLFLPLRSFAYSAVKFTGFTRIVSPSFLAFSVSSVVIDLMNSKVLQVVYAVKE